MSATPREHLAWLMWCYQEGYVNVEDREGMENWLLDDPATLHPDDAKLRPHLLAMADEILLLIDGPVTPVVGNDPAESSREISERFDGEDRA